MTTTPGNGPDDQDIVTPEVPSGHRGKGVLGKLGDMFRSKSPDAGFDAGRRNFLLGRRPADVGTGVEDTSRDIRTTLLRQPSEAEQAEMVPPALATAISAYVAFSGIQYVIKKVNGGFAVDLDHSKVVDQDKAQRIMTAGIGDEGGLFPWLWNHFGGGIGGLLIGAWIGNKFIRSPKASEKAEAVAERDGHVGRLSSKLGKRGLFGTAAGQFSESRLKLPNMGPKVWSEHFKQFDTTPETVLAMLDTCVESMQEIQKEIRDAGSTSLTPQHVTKLRNVFNAYNLDKATLVFTDMIHEVPNPTAGATPAMLPPTLDQIDTLIGEVEFVRDNPTETIVQNYIRDRILEVKKAVTDPQLALDVAKIEEANQKISKEVPFFTAAGQVISGQGETSRREFLKNIGIPAAIVAGLGWGIIDPPVFGDSVAEKAAKEAAERDAAAKKAAEDITGKYKPRPTPEGKQGLIDAARGTSNEGTPVQREEKDDDDDAHKEPSKDEFINGKW